MQHVCCFLSCIDLDCGHMCRHKLEMSSKVILEDGDIAEAGKPWELVQTVA